MKICWTVIFIAATLLVSAGEREMLLKAFEEENSEAEKILQSARTTVELTRASGHCREISKNQFFRALDHKLRHIPAPAERLQILENMHRLSREIGQVQNAPRKELGSLAGMQIYLRIVRLFRHQTAILMLDAEAERRWKRIADAEIVIDGKKIRLRHGRAEFEAIRHDQKVTLEIMLFPEDTFSYRDHDFAVIRTDIPFPVNSNFSSVYRCERKGSQLAVLPEDFLLRDLFSSHPSSSLQENPAALRTSASQPFSSRNR